MSKDKVQDDKILLRLPSQLTQAIDQIVREQLNSLNRSEFIRRAVRYTLDHIDEFKGSDSAVISETQPVESVEKINAVRDLWDQVFRYTETVLTDPTATISEKRLAFLNRLTAHMIFRMND